MTDIETLTAAVLRTFKTTAQKTQVRAVPFAADEIVRRALADTAHRHAFLETVEVEGVAVSVYGIPTLSKKLLVFTADDGKAYSGFAPMSKPAAPRVPKALKKAAPAEEPKAKHAMPIVTAEPKNFEADERIGVGARTHNGERRLFTYVRQGAAVGDRVVSDGWTTRIVELADVSDRGRLVYLEEERDFDRVIAVMSALAREPKQHDELFGSTTQGGDKEYLKSVPGTFTAGDRFASTTGRGSRELVVTGLGKPFQADYSTKWVQYAYVVRAEAYDAMTDTDKAALPKDAAEAEVLAVAKAKETAKTARRAATVLGGRALTGTPKQKAWAEKIRAAVLAKAPPSAAEEYLSGEKFRAATYWIENHRNALPR
ncbi:hypothetical protein [Mesorhizobium sp. B2-4-17]|uniref:hypothetical protein n=1 Tax=Mesorhizobium sp. B2-4-17 TaxID=2589932 RepID=UPI00112E33C5|nr:hypothetical protein [Mesorhizobium sp. B2-4-17]TPK91484.1 hypothetical protein FJ548_04390 [Mesorhizobium sp. B2-4-17]